MKYIATREGVEVLTGKGPATDKQKEMVDSLGNPLSDEEIAARKKNEEQLAHEQDPHFPEYYLVQIPKTEEEIQNSHNIVQEDCLIWA